MPPSPLARWLAGLDAGRLARVLAHRMEALAPPPVGTLSGLAARLQEPAAVAAALRGLPLPAIQLIEVIQSFGGPAAERGAVAATVGRPPDDPHLAAVLELLADRALVWPDGDRLRVAGPLRGAFQYPLGLGAPARSLLETVPATQLRSIAGKLGARGRARTEVLDAVAARLADAGFVRALVATAPPAARDLLERLAAHGPLLLVDGGVRAAPDLAWPVEHGLVVYDGWRYAQLVGEAGRALRGPGWRAPFAGGEPEIPLRDADPEAADLAGAAAATVAVQQVAALLDACAHTPVALLKAGGVGSRELKRLGRAIGEDIPRVRLWLELGYAAGLLGTAQTELLPTPGYDAWCAAAPAERLVPLVRAWLALPAAATTDRSGFGGDAPALTRDQLGLTAYELRPHVLAAAARLPRGRGVADAERLTEALRWRLPLLIAGDDEEFDEPVEPPLTLDAWREANLLGMVAHGALTTLGRALMAEWTADPAGPDSAGRDRAGVDGRRKAGARATAVAPGADGELAAVAARIMPPAMAEALFQADLTAVVPGAPAAPLAALLDAAADRESRGGGATWRFSADSVRRALDAGRDAVGLLAELRAAAAGRALPQPLEYLVTDVARRHGSIRVRKVGCVLRAEDPALLAELAGVRALAPLGLAVLAPTILASTRPPAETLAALRAAGYAPVGEGKDGATLVERAPARRAEPARHPAPISRPGQPFTAPALPEAWPSAGTAPHGAAVPEAARSLAEALLAGPPEPSPPAGSPPVRAARQHATILAGTGDGAIVIDLTARLAAAVAEAEEPVDEPFAIAAAVGLHAGHLPPAQQRLLVAAIERGTLVKIEYTDAGNRTSVRMIEPLELIGNRLHAWCELREDERHFSLDRIDAVHPV